MAATLRVRLLAGASPDAPAAEVDDLGRRTASPAVTLVVHVHALAAPHAVDGLAELRRINRRQIRDRVTPQRRPGVTERAPISAGGMLPMCRWRALTIASKPV